MDGLSIIIGLLIGLALGGGAAFYIARLKFQKEPSGNRSDEDVNRIIDLEAQIARKEEVIRGLEEKVANNAENLKKQSELLEAQFKALANKILEEKSEKFTKENKENLDSILKPLKENIEKFEKAVHETNKEQLGRHSALKEQLNQLSDLNKQMSTDAKNLVRALKGDNKASGNWGELVLERVLERSGLNKGVEYIVQESHTMDDGKRRLQPDVVIKLPDDKNVIVDSKVSLLDYERYVSAEDDDKETSLKAFINSVRTHMKGLSEKDYQSLHGSGSLDFVLMFIPIEPAFSTVLQFDDKLYGDAYERNIIIVSPSTLLASLRTIANIWKHEYQNKNILEIVKESEKMYDKFRDFTEDLLSVGNRMKQSKTAYDAAMNKLVDGRGSLVTRAEKLKKLGANPSKVINKDLVDRAAGNENDERSLNEATD